MLNYQNSFFYQLKTKKRLKEILKIRRDIYLDGEFINRKIKVYFDKNNRLIESPDKDILSIQYRIQNALKGIGVPSYIFSSQGKSYSDFQAAHKKFHYTWKIDICKFYYNIGRTKVYQFYKDMLSTSSDVAKILTDYSTINLKKKIGLDNYAQENAMKSNHLIVGAPQSPHLSVLANYQMFEQIQAESFTNGLYFSAYADDFWFSSDDAISEGFQQRIIEIIDNFNFKINLEKITFIDNHEGGFQ